MGRLRIEGWIPLNSGYPDLTGARLKDKDYGFSCIEVEVKNLQVLPLVKFVGGILSLFPVQGVVDITKGAPLAPFFIDKRKVDLLKFKIEKANKDIPTL